MRLKIRLGIITMKYFHPSTHFFWKVTNVNTSGASISFTFTLQGTRSDILIAVLCLRALTHTLLYYREELGVNYSLENQMQRKYNIFGKVVVV